MKNQRRTPSLSCGQEPTEWPLLAGNPTTSYFYKRPVQFLQERVMPQLLLMVNLESQQIPGPPKRKLRAIWHPKMPKPLTDKISVTHIPNQDIPHLPKSELHPPHLPCRNQQFPPLPKSQLHLSTNLPSRNHQIPHLPKSKLHLTHLPGRNQPIQHLPKRKLHPVELPGRSQQIAHFQRSEVHWSHLPGWNQQVLHLPKSDLQGRHLPGRQQLTMVIVKPYTLGFFPPHDCNE